MPLSAGKGNDYCWWVYTRISTYGGSYLISFMGCARCVYAPPNAATQQLNSTCCSDLLIPCALQIRTYSRIRSSIGMDQCAVICYKQIMSSSLIPYQEKLGHLRKGEQMVLRKSSQVLVVRTQKPVRLSIAFFHMVTSIRYYKFTV